MSEGRHSWLHSTSTRSKRTVIVKEGCLVLEHEPTGRFYVTESLTVSDEADSQLKLLVLGKHPSKLFNGIYKLDGDVRVFEYECKAKAARKKLYAELLIHPNTQLCLNPEVYDLHKRKRRRRSNPEGA